MNWKKLDQNIKSFASENRLDIESKELPYIGGKITYYQLKEGGVLFYELKHSKPINTYGSKFRVFSKVPERELLIKTRQSFFGKKKVVTKGLENDEIQKRLDDLLKSINSFK